MNLRPRFTQTRQFRAKITKVVSNLPKIKIMGITHWSNSEKLLNPIGSHIDSEVADVNQDALVFLKVFEWRIFSTTKRIEHFETWKKSRRTANDW